MKSTLLLLAIFSAFGFALGSAYSAENLLANGDLETGSADPWATYGQAEIVIETDDMVDGQYALRVTVNEQGANFWDSGLQHDPGNHVFEQGKLYTLSAFLKSPDGLGINFKPELGQDPWTGYGEAQFTMTEDWEEYHITTPAMTENVSPATITFHIAFAAGTFLIDDVQFYEGEYVPTVITPVEPKAKLTTTWAAIKKGDD